MRKDGTGDEPFLRPQLDLRFLRIQQHEWNCGHTWASERRYQRWEGENKKKYSLIRLSIPNNKSLLLSAEVFNATDCSSLCLLIRKLVEQLWWRQHDHREENLPQIAFSQSWKQRSVLCHQWHHHILHIVSWDILPFCHRYQFRLNCQKGSLIREICCLECRIFQIDFLLICVHLLCLLFRDHGWFKPIWWS